MIFFLDANIIISILRKKTGSRVSEIVSRYSKIEIKIPSMVKAELLVGAYKSDKTESNLESIRKILLPFEIVPFDDRATEIYGVIKAELEKEQKTIGPKDLIIAATAMSRGGILVTNNTREFGRVKGLQIEDWLSEAIQNI